MATQEEEFHTDLLETMIDNNNRTKTPFFKKETLTSNLYHCGKNGRQKRNANNVTTKNFIHPPVTTNAQKKKTDVANERR